MRRADIYLPGIARIRTRYLLALNERACHLAQSIDELRTPSTPRRARAVLSDMQQLLSKLAGSSAMLGFEELGEAATYCETMLHKHKGRPDLERAPLLDLLDQFLSAIEAMPEMQESLGEAEGVAVG